MPLFSTMAGSDVRPTVFHGHRAGAAAFQKPSRRKALLRAALSVLAGGLLAAPAMGATAYWDTNGSAPGAVNTAASPANGTWGVNTYWNLIADGTGPTGAWNSGDTAVFAAGTGISGGLATGTNLITVSGNQTAAQLTFKDGLTTLSGGTLTLQGAGSSAGLIVLGGPSNQSIQTINSVISGFNGLTVQRSGLVGAVNLGAANTFFGPLTINSARVNLNASGAASTGNIVLNSTQPGNQPVIGSTAIINSVIDIPNQISFNANSGADISSNTGVTLNLTGKLTGTGAWSHGGNGSGTLVLNNTTNDFSGTLTISSGLVVVAADHALGIAGAASPPQATGSNTVITGTGQIAFQSVNNMTYSLGEQIIIQSSATAGVTQINNISGDNTFMGGVQFNQGTLNTIGVDGGTLTLAGQVITVPPGAKPFAKVGAGTLILTGENTTGFNSSVSVNAGTLRLGGTGTTTGDIALADTVNINNGSLLHLDNSAGNNQDRIGNTATVNFNGGRLLLKGNSAEDTHEDIGFINYGPGEDVLSTITVDPGAGRSAIFSAGSMTRASGGLMVFRTPGLGQPPAPNQGQIKFSSTPLLSGAGGSGVDKSIIAGALGDTSITGQGSELVTYDEVVGVKPLSSLDYAADIVSGSQLLNNIAVASSQAIAADTAVNSMKLIDPGAAVSIDAGATLTIGSGMILASATSTDGINGAGILTFGSGNDGIIAGPGDLTVSANINAPTALIKAGTGKLTLSGVNTISTFYISGGTVLPTVASALGDNSSVHIGGGGTLELLDGMDLSTADVYLHDGGRILGRGNSAYSRSARISDGATVILEASDPEGVLKINQPLANQGTGALRPTISLRGPGTVSFVSPGATFFGNFELRNGVTVPLEPRVDMLGNNGNSLIFGPGGGKLQMNSLSGGQNWGNNVVINGDATFQDMSANGTDTFGSLTVNTPATIHHYLPTGLNFIDPRLNFGNTALYADPTFNIDRPPIAGDYGRLTISNVREFNGPRSITKIGEGILNIAGSAGFTGDLNASDGIVIIPDSVPTLRGVTGSGIVIGSVNIKAGGHVDPGTNGVGTLLIEGITLNGTPTNKTQLNMEGDATGFDKLFVFGQEKFHLNGESVINLVNLGGVTAGEYVLIDYLINPISDEEFNKLSLASPIFNGSNASLVHDPGSTQIRLHLEGPPPPQWGVDADGNWNNLANWDPATIPDGISGSANFFDKITAPRTVTLDGSRTVTQLKFSNNNSYTIASDGAGSTLTLGSADNNAVINVGLGTHRVTAPLVMAGNVFMTISAGSALQLTGGLTIADGKTATMLADGTLEVGGPQNYGAGSVLDLKAGKVKFNSNAGTPASAAAAATATLSLKISGDGASVTLGSDQDLASIRVDFDQAGNQSFDLASPAGPGAFRSVRVYASDLASAKTSLYGAIRTANVAGAPSATDGIYDSGLATHFGMKLGIAQLVDSHGDDYILMRPTRTGDLNLDGAVTISDFIDLASNFNHTGATWQEGDLNYDGQVTISDFIDLASNFNGTYAGSLGAVSAEDQELLASFAASIGVDPSVIGSAVPEPTALGLLGGAAILLGGRRRRK